MAQDKGVAARIELIAPRLEHISDMWEGGGSDIALMKLRDEAVQLLKSHDLIFKMNVHSEFVGVHPRNRFGKGIVPRRVHSLLTGMIGDGVQRRGVGQATGIGDASCEP